MVVAVVVVIVVFIMPRSFLLVIDSLENWGEEEAEEEMEDNEEEEVRKGRGREGKQPGGGEEERKEKEGKGVMGGRVRRRICTIVGTRIARWTRSPFGWSNPTTSPGPIYIRGPTTPFSVCDRGLVTRISSLFFAVSFFDRIKFKVRQSEFLLS